MSQIPRRYLPLVIALSAVVCLCAEPLTNLYFHNPDDAVYQMTVWGFRIFPWCMPLTLVTMHFRCYGNAMGNNWYVHVIALIDGLFGVLVFSALLMPVMQLNAVFLSFVHKGDELILRIKDDCQQFDPAERSRMVDPDDKASNIGIRMVFGIATSVTYQHILGINVLTMRI